MINYCNLFSSQIIGRFNISINALVQLGYKDVVQLVSTLDLWSTCRLVSTWQELVMMQMINEKTSEPSKLKPSTMVSNIVDLISIIVQLFKSIPRELCETLFATLLHKILYHNYHMSRICPKEFYHHN